MSDDGLPAGTPDRRTAVLDSALATFARFGYRRSSMDEVARAAHISRPGLYFLFASKEALFRAAVARVLEQDLDAVEGALAEPGRPLRERLLRAFDHWAGRYVGAAGRDVTAVIDDNPGILGDTASTASQRFADLVEASIATETDADRARALTATLISTSLGLKHQVEERDAYRERLDVALGLLVG